jgi:hypothetical protein
VDPLVGPRTATSLGFAPFTSANNLAHIEAASNRSVTGLTD